MMVNLFGGSRIRVDWKSGFISFWALISLLGVFIDSWMLTFLGFIVFIFSIMDEFYVRKPEIVE